MSYDPEFEPYTPEVAAVTKFCGTDLNAFPWLNEPFDFHNLSHGELGQFQLESDTSVLADLTPLSQRSPKEEESATPEELDVNGYLVSEFSRQASPVPDAFCSEDPVPLSPEPTLAFPVKTPVTLPKKVATNAKVTKAKSAVPTPAHVVPVAVSKKKTPATAPAPKKASSPGPGSFLTEEERKERNKIAAQKYRQKCREQANDAQVKCDQLIEEQKQLKLFIEKEREKIKEIRDLLIKHGLI